MKIIKKRNNVCVRYVYRADEKRREHQGAEDTLTKQMRVKLKSKFCPHLFTPFSSRFGMKMFLVDPPFFHPTFLRFLCLLHIQTVENIFFFFFFLFPSIFSHSKQTLRKKQWEIILSHCQMISTWSASWLLHLGYWLKIRFYVIS